jgi:hypothetical protein
MKNNHIRFILSAACLVTLVLSGEAIRAQTSSQITMTPIVISMIPAGSVVGTSVNAPAKVESPTVSREMSKRDQIQNPNEITIVLPSHAADNIKNPEAPTKSEAKSESHPLGVSELRNNKGDGITITLLKVQTPEPGK